MSRTLFEGIVTDVRLAWRSLVRHPVFALISLLSISIGVGGCAVAFAIAAQIHWRPLPLDAPNELVEVIDGAPDVLSTATADAWTRELARAGVVTRWRSAQVVLSTPTGAVRLAAAAVDTGFLRTLGAAPILGARVADALERQPGSVILSHGAWRRYFAGDSAIVGRGVLLDERQVLVVGVMSADLDYPAGTQAWLLDRELPPAGSRRAFTLLARANATADVAHLQTIAAVQSPLDGEQGSARSHGLARPLVEILRPEVGRGTAALFAGSALLLLIATLNTLLLFVGRAVERRHGMAVRVALGASSLRLARLFGLEAALLGMIGGLGGFTIAIVIVRLIAWIGWFERAGMEQLVVGWPGLAVAVGLGLVSATLAALLPPLLARHDVGALLRTAGSHETRAIGRVRDALVVVEVALALLLSSAAALLFENYAGSQRAAVAFRVDHTVFASVTLPASLEPAQRQVLVNDVLDRLRDTPAITEVTAWGTFYPNSGRKQDEAITLEGVGVPQRYAGSPAWSFDVAPDLFRTLDLRVTRGRSFDENDVFGSAPVVILTEAACAALWPGQDPLGRRIKLGPPSEASPWMTVVGVVENTQPLHGLAGRYAVSRGLGFHMMFRPLAQGEVRGLDFSSPPGFAIAALPRSSDELAIVALREALLGAHPSIIIEYSGRMREYLNRAGDLDLGRMVSQSVLVTCTIALLLALVGVAAVVRESIRRRRQEFGIRLALGAAPFALVRLVVRDASRLGVIGTAIGGVLSLALLGAFGAWLVRDSRPGSIGDALAVGPLLIAAVGIIVVTLVGLVAFSQARAVAEIDPADVMRTE